MKMNEEGLLSERGDQGEYKLGSSQFFFIRKV